MNRLQIDMRFREIMGLHAERLIRVAYYYTKDLHTAEDIVQEVFLKFYQSYEKYNEQGELKAYLTRLTINQSKDYLKSWTYRKMQFQQKWVKSIDEKHSAEFVRKDEQALIGAAIMQLSVKQREVIAYYYFEEMTIVQISEILQIPLSTVKTRLRRSKELLRPQLKGIEWEVLLHE